MPYAATDFGGASQLFNQDQQVRNATADAALRNFIQTRQFQQQMAEQMATRDQNAGFTQQELDINRAKGLAEATRYQNDADYQKNYLKMIADGGGATPAEKFKIGQQTAAGLAQNGNGQNDIGWWKERFPWMDDNTALNHATTNKTVQDQLSTPYTTGMETARQQNLIDHANRTLTAATQPAPSGGFWGGRYNPRNWGWFNGGTNPVTSTDTSWVAQQRARLGAFQQAHPLNQALITRNPDGSWGSAAPMPTFMNPMYRNTGGIGVVPSTQVPTAGVPTVQLGQPFQVPNVGYDIVGNRGNLNGAMPVGLVSVINPKGKRVKIPQDQLQDALTQGYTSVPPVTEFAQ